MKIGRSRVIEKNWKQNLYIEQNKKKKKMDGGAAGSRIRRGKPWMPPDSWTDSVENGDRPWLSPRHATQSSPGPVAASLACCRSYRSQPSLLI